MATIKDTGNAYDLYLSALELRLLRRLSEARCRTVDEELEDLLRSGILVMDESGSQDIFFQYAGEETPEELLCYPDSSGASTGFSKNPTQTDALLATLDVLYTEAWTRGYLTTDARQYVSVDPHLAIKHRAIKAALVAILKIYKQSTEEVVLTHVQQRVPEN